jgi:tetratricopeptide (TPR) repeat protein
VVSVAHRKSGRKQPPKSDRAFRRARSAAPHHAFPELEAAKSLWARQKFDEALAQFLRAVERYPNSEIVLIDAARANGLRYNFARAEELIDRVRRLYGGRPEILCLCGETYRMIGRFRQASECFERACQLQPKLPRARVELAEMYERLHDLDGAVDQALAALSCDRRFARAALVIARVHRRRRETEKAEALLLEQLKSPPPTAEPHAALWGELGLLYDQIGHYDQAYEAALAGKRLWRAREKEPLRQSQIIRRQSERMLDTITAEHFERWRERLQHASPLRVALLTSHPRSGTTIIEQALDSHPGLVSSDERPVFGDEILPALGAGIDPNEQAMPDMLDRVADERVLRERRRYIDYMEALLGEPIGGRIHLDKNPELTLLIPAMLRVFPELKIVVALRDPRDVVISCFMRSLPLNSVTVNYLTLERTAEKYALMMGGWLKLRELIGSPWIEVRYEDAVNDLESQVRRLLGFFELPWDAAVLRFHEHAMQKHVRSPTYENVTSPIYATAIGRWRNYAKHLEPILENLKPLITALGY